jgi:hypothetical protein
MSDSQSESRSNEAVQRSEMAQSVKRESVITGLVVIASLLAGGREARALQQVPSVRVIGGIVQDGDPAYTYQLEVFSTNGGLVPTTTLSLEGLVGVDMNSATSIIAEYGGAGAWTAGAITTDPRSPIDGYTVSDVT